MPISPPRLDDGTALPAVLFALLCAVFVAQFFMAGDAEVPEEGVGRVGGVAEVGAPAAAVPQPVVLARALFAPGRRPGNVAISVGGAAAANAPLGGAVVAGAVSRRGSARAFLKLPDGTIRVMTPGAVYEGWRLAAVTGDGARFVRGGEVVTLPFGSAAPVQAGGDEDEDESSDE